MPNPFEWLAKKAVGELVVDTWTSIMLVVWSGGLWFFKWVLGFIDTIMTPDISATGPAGQVYQYTYWLALSLVVILAVAQLGWAAFRRDGGDLADAGIGLGQFIVVLVCWISYCVMILAAVQGLTAALMQAMFGVDRFGHWEPSGVSFIATEDVTDTVLATVLGFMGLFLWAGAVGFLLVMLTRAGALIVLVATAPIAAAGLASGFSRSWFWKANRWFHAAAFTPLVIALVLGLGIALTSGVVSGEADGLAKTVGTAIPGVFLICIACFSPLALFKMLAFVDPGTQSGAAMRAGMEAQGGLRGLASRDRSSGSNAASSLDSQGRSSSEVSAEGEANQRTGKAVGTMASRGGAAIGGVAGVVGAGVGIGVNAMVSAGTRGAVVGADIANQMGAGHNNYVPDFQPTKRGRPARAKTPEQRGEDQNDQQGGDGSPGSGGVVATPPPAQANPSTGGGLGAGGGGAGGAAGGVK
ncbi:type IV secretion system protein [Ornithinimicrobium sp. F0845]|uniref:type IV secretion system protein n=1 Tax=Ornithinimicrobium sp. F0845 TaxID=2926412 RepID=UPI001FF5D6B5|nr:type IV secretion system protein [Ornithinimicrobium sp. F0845]MCK0113522.1 type IV secretion system protein [Ornithinimicrobium sp. F0845]